MVAANLDERLGWKSAGSDEFFAVGKRHRVVGPAVQDHRVRLERRDRAPSFLYRAEQDQRGFFRVDVRGDRTTTRQADDQVGLVPVVFGLSSVDDGVEVVAIESRIQDFVASLLK